MPPPHQLRCQFPHHALDGKFISCSKTTHNILNTQNRKPLCLYSLVCLPVCSLTLGYNPGPFCEYLSTFSTLTFVDLTITVVALHPFVRPLLVDRPGCPLLSCWVPFACRITCQINSSPVPLSLCFCWSFGCLFLTPTTNHPSHCVLVVLAFPETAFVFWKVSDYLLAFRVVRAGVSLIYYRKKLFVIGHLAVHRQQFSSWQIQSLPDPSGRSTCSCSSIAVGLNWQKVQQWNHCETRDSNPRSLDDTNFCSPRWIFTIYIPRGY